jgi:hypothetical protein
MVERDGHAFGASVLKPFLFSWKESIGFVRRNFKKNAGFHVL